MATNNGSQVTPPGNGGGPPTAPAMPTVPADELYRGTPDLLVDNLRHSVGWQDARKAGPSFVVTTRRPGGSIKVLQRFPLSERGWADAWHVLSGLDAGAAAAIGAKLADLEAGRREAAALAALDARSLCYLASVAFDGGSGRESLTRGQYYDLRFQDDRVMVCGLRSTHDVLEWPYADVENIDVSGPTSQPTGVVLGLISGFGLAGALLGYFVLVPRGLGLLVGAVVLGLVGGIIAAFASRGETIIRVRGRGAEFQFLVPLKRPDDLRRALTGPLLAIRRASTQQAGTPDEPAEPPSDSLADQLAKLASLLQQDLITREEFEHLKARVIAQP